MGCADPCEYAANPKGNRAATMATANVFIFILRTFLAGLVLCGNSFSDLPRLSLLGGCKFDPQSKAIFAIGIGGQLPLNGIGCSPPVDFLACPEQTPPPDHLPLRSPRQAKSMNGSRPICRARQTDDVKVFP